MAEKRDGTPKLGGKMAIILFVIVLLAFVVESQLTQYVQTNLGYRQPYLIFYIVHSAFSLIFPLHLLYLLARTDCTSSTLFNSLHIAISEHLSGPGAPFPRRKFTLLVFALTVGITFPSLLWFAAISLASVSDVTAIWNTNAFFAYLISVKLFNLKWEPRRLAAVCLATLGVMAVIYGGSTSSVPPIHSTPESLSAAALMRPKSPLLGDLLTLGASVGSALYAVFYKKHAALPSDPDELIADDHAHDGIMYTQLPASDHSTEGRAADWKEPPPFGLHSNLLTSLIGLCTLLLLWFPIPLLHWTDIEPFEIPPNSAVVLAIVGIALSGVIVNAGIMILLGVWGPIITSVGNLLTIVLVFLSDVLFGQAAEILTVWSVLGSGVIVSAFGMLAYDMYHSQLDRTVQIT